MHNCKFLVNDAQTKVPNKLIGFIINTKKNYLKFVVYNYL